MSQPYTPPPTEEQYDAYSAGAAASRGVPFRGMRRRNRRTGEVQVWVQGQGYLPEGSIAALPTRDQEDMTAARALLRTGMTNARLAEQFSQVNRQPPQDFGNPIFNYMSRGLGNTGGETGGAAGIPFVPPIAQNPQRQRMEGLTANMVRANIREGTSGTLNSMFEQMLARQQYPQVEHYGSVNDERTIQMLVDADEMAALLDAAEQWGREHRGLQGFDVDWYRNQQRRVRSESEARHRQRLGLARQGGTQGAGAANDPLGIRNR